MKLNPITFLIFRFYNITFGRLGIGELLMRRFLGCLLIKRRVGKDTYCQSSEFFTYDQLKEE